MLDALDLIAEGREPIATLNLLDDEPRICLESRHRSVRGSTPAQHYRHELVFALPELVDFEALSAEIDSRLYAPLLVEIEEGYGTYSDGNREVASYTPEAERAIKALAEALAAARELNVLDNPPAGFRASVTMRVSDRSLEAYTDGLLSDGQYNEVLGSYCGALEEAVQRRFPEIAVEVVHVDGTMDPEKILVSAWVSHGGDSVRAQLEERFRDEIREIDTSQIADDALARLVG